MEPRTTVRGPRPPLSERRRPPFAPGRKTRALVRPRVTSRPPSSSSTARLAIIREMLANAVAPSQRAAGSLPAPRLTPARSPDTGTATAANAKTPAEPLTALGLASAPQDDGRQAEEPCAPSTPTTLSH